jgi:hypothetical protein
MLRANRAILAKALALLRLDTLTPGGQLQRPQSDPAERRKVSGL